MTIKWKRRDMDGDVWSHCGRFQIIPDPAPDHVRGARRLVDHETNQEFGASNLSDAKWMAEREVREGLLRKHK